MLMQDGKLINVSRAVIRDGNAYSIEFHEDEQYAHIKRVNPDGSADYFRLQNYGGGNTGALVVGDNVSDLVNDANYATIDQLFSESYNDLTDLPTLFDGNYNTLTNKPVLFDGFYDSLINPPPLFDGDYNSLSNLPTLFSGNYLELTNTPELGVLDMSQFFNRLYYTDGNLTSVLTYADNTQNDLIYSKTLTYANGALTQIQVTNELLQTTETKTLTYDLDGNLKTVTKS